MKNEKEPPEVLSDFLIYIDKCRHDYQAAHDAVGMEDKRLQDLLHGLEFAADENENRPALELIRAFDHENVLIYCDPPYVLSTRSWRQYRFEMTDDDYEALLQELCKSRAKVMLSGYENSLYDRYLNGWRKEQITARAQNTGLRIETLWMNY